MAGVVAQNGTCWEKATYYTAVNSDDRSAMRAMADRCVKCAQCLPHCPTWRLDHNEAESPRGRIALIDALADGFQGDATFADSIDRCLGCGQCEAVCPASVPYASLLHAARASVAPPRRNWRGWALRRLTARPALFRRLVILLLRFAARASLHPALPPKAATAPGAGVYGDGLRGDVALFIGCVATALDGATLRAARDALVDAGYRVHVPAKQGCCGALHRHAGERDTANQLGTRNRAAFAGDMPIAVTASGCGAELARDQAFGARVIDISALLRVSESPRPAAPGTVVHTPCTLATTNDRSAAAALLPGATSTPVAGRCCGGAGEYLLRNPREAARLRDEVLDEIGDAAVVCTSNIGCALHLRAGLRARGRDTEVVHPVVEWRRRGNAD